MQLGKNAKRDADKVGGKENEGGNVPIFEEASGGGGGIGLGYAKWAGRHSSVMKQVRQSVEKTG